MDSDSNSASYESATTRHTSSGGGGGHRFASVADETCHCVFSVWLSVPSNESLQWLTTYRIMSVNNGNQNWYKGQQYDMKTIHFMADECGDDLWARRHVDGRLSEFKTFIKDENDVGGGEFYK